jgi:beta-glucosidase
MRSGIVANYLCGAAILACAILAPKSGLAQTADTGLPNGLPSGEGIYDVRSESKIESLLSRMTLDEKVGQLVQVGLGPPQNGGGTKGTNYEEMIKEGRIGAILGPDNAKDINTYQHMAVASSRLHIPIIFGLDVIHGFRTIFPIPLALASTWDPELVQHVAHVAAREASAAGIRWTFSPMVDIARDARWGRIAEGAGEDPYLGSVMAAAYVRGYQGQHLDDPDSIAACAKHFVGYGAAEGGRDYNTTEISDHTLREIYLPPFQAAVNAGAATIMSAFNSLNGVPASANRFTLTQVLRNEWGFRGFVDSDALSIRELVAHGIADDVTIAARKAFLAGVDMDMGSDLYHAHLANLVQSGEVPPGDLDEAVRRVLRVKFALGLFTRPYVDESKYAKAMLRPDAIELARTAAERSFVLLKNAPYLGGKPLLPLSDKLARIALIGPLANDAPDMLGTWADAGHSDDVVTLRTALARRIGAAHLSYVQGTGFTDGKADSASEIEAAVNTARKADLVILALGESAEMSGEAASRAYLTLPGRQEELLEKVVAIGKPVVLVLFSGRPLTLPWAFDKLPAVISAWAPGIQAGPALVRTLYGESNPSGKLVMSWPRSVGQEPLYYNALSTGRPFGVDGQEKFSPRYIDEDKNPQFPFGFGLSYTTFRYAPTEISAKQLHASTLNSSLKTSGVTALSVSAVVTNTGPVTGDEVVQLYLHLEGASTAEPIRELKGFQRVSLAPGESKKVVFNLPSDAFANWDIQNHRAIEATKATMWVSPDSEHGTGVDLQIAP